MKVKSYFLLLGVFLLTVCFTYGQANITGSGKVKTENRNLSGFTQVETLGSINVYITKAGNYEVKLEADDNLLPFIITEVKNNALILRMKEHTSFRKSGKINAYVSMPNVTAVTTKGSGSINSESTFTGTELVLKTKGSGSIHFAFDGKGADISTAGSGGIKFSGKINEVKLGTLGSGSIEASLECESAALSVTGSGGIHISGNATNVTAGVIGSGNIDGYGFQCKRAKVSIKGSGNCNLSVSETLAGEIHGSGNIQYKGNATVQSPHSQGQGKIRKE